MKLILLFLLAVITPQSAPQLSRIEGVITSSTGEPLDGARVILRRGPPVRLLNVNGIATLPGAYGTMTAAGGKFAFKDVAGGTYHIIVSMSGYITSEYGQKRPNGPSTLLDLSAGQDMRDLKISLIPGGTIAGRVYDQNGRPIARATVQALVPRYTKGVRVLTLGATAETNDLGDYRMFWMAPGQYYILATAPRPGGNTNIVPVAVDQFDGNEEVYPPLFYPNADDEAGARALRLEAGAELRGIDFVMTRVQTVRITGRVVTPEGRTPVAGANVNIRSKTSYGNLHPQAAPQGSTLGFVARTDNQGNFELRHVVPRVYTFHVTNPTAGGPASMVRQEIPVGNKDIAGIELTLGPPMAISGRLIIEETASQTPEFTPTLILIPAEESGGEDYGAKSYRTGIGPNGTFLFNAVEPNIFRIETQGLPANFYLRSARMGRREVLQTGIDLREGSPDTLELTIARDAGMVDGVVSDDNLRPTPGAQVVMVPAIQNRSRFELFKTATTDQMGRFSIENAVPGEYKLFAWEDLEPGDYFDPALLGRHESRGTVLHLLPNGRATHNLTVIPAP